MTAAIPQPLPSRRVLIVLNPGAPRHEEVSAALETLLPGCGPGCEVVETPKDDATAFVEEHVGRAIHEGWDRVLAAGGDGTVSLVAQALARCTGPRPRLGIVPGGTTNLLARELGIPLEPRAALEVALGSDLAIELDAIRVRERFLFTQVGIGPDAVMIQETSSAERKKSGRLAYIRTFLRRGLRQPRRRFRLKVDGHPVAAHAWQLIVANAGSAGTPPFTWGPRIDPADGIADLCIFDVRGFGDYVALLWRALTGRHRKDARARFLRVKQRLDVEADRPTLAQGDGEVLGRIPLVVHVVPAALTVVVAKPVEEEAGDGDGDEREAASGPQRASAAGERRRRYDGPSVHEDEHKVSTEEIHAAETAKEEAATTGGPQETVGEEVESMVAQQSSTWVLQGVLRHPVTWVQAFDAAVFLRVNRLHLGEGVARGLEGLSRLMHYGEGWIIAVLAMMAVDLRAGLRATAEALPVLWLTMLTVNFPLKSLFRRRRPFLAFVKARVLGPRPRDFSFPSGHTAAAFGGAFLLSAHAPGWAAAFYSVAAVIGFSRIYLGVHYPGDVVIGGAAGIALAFAYRALIHAVFPGLAPPAP